MKLTVDFRRITLDQLEALQGNQVLQRSTNRRRWPWQKKGLGSTESQALRQLLAQFLAEDDGTPIPYDQAIKRVGSLTLETIMEATAQIAESMKEVGKTAIPPAKGGS